MNTTTAPQSGRRIIWINVMTVASAAILIGAEVFGAAFAGSWAIANLFGLGTTVGRVLFNAAIPEGLQFVNKVMDRVAIREVVIAVFEWSNPGTLGPFDTGQEVHRPQ